MRTIADRFNDKLKELGLDQKDIAERINVSPTAISKIANGETKRSRFLPAIAEALGVSEQWLIFGDEPNAELLDVQIDEWDDKSPLPPDMVEIPYYCDMSLSAGHGSLNGDMPYTGAKLWYAKSFIKKKGTCPSKVFCVKVRGDSMSPAFEEGGIVMIDTLNKQIIDGKPYAVTYQGEDYIKYVRRIPDNQIRLVSENKAYEPFDAPLEEVKIVGRVIEYSKEW